MDIVFCLDNNFVMQTGVAMTSVCENNQTESIKFHLISTSLSNESQMDLRDIVAKYGKEICFYIVDDSLLDNCPVNVPGQCETVSIATYLKVFIVNILPDNIDKVLYLDGDLIVRGSLTDLWNTDVSEVSLAAVRDIIADDIRLYNRLCYYDPSFGYVNTGVVLFNLKFWKEHNVLGQCLDYMSKYPERLITKEQDLMNAVLVGKIGFLPFKYNLQILFLQQKSILFVRMDYFSELDNAIQNPVVLHYIAYPKPWLKEYDLPYKCEWIKYQNRTKWAGMKQKHMKKWLTCLLKKMIRNLLGKSVRRIREDLPKY
ncbi:glycosyltransferase family 8 protein [Parabacteroides sp.]